LDIGVAGRVSAPRPLARVGERVLEVRVVQERPEGLAARRRSAVLERPPVLGQEEPVLQPHVEVIPGQPPVDGQRHEVGRRIDARLRERLGPHLQAEAVVPAVEARALAPRRLDHIRERPITAAQQALDPRHRALVVLELHVLGARHLAQEPLLAHDLLVRILRAPLERRVRLGHVRGHGHGHVRVVADLLAHAPQAPAGLRDADHVLVRLRRQADHEVALHARPPAREDVLGRARDVLFRDVLVDHVAHALRPGLGRKRQAGGAHARHLVEDLGV
jgi:hypothetical protein